MALSVCFVFTVTIGVFPAVTVEVRSTVSAGGTWGKSVSVLIIKTCGACRALKSSAFCYTGIPRDILHSRVLLLAL